MIGLVDGDGTEVQTKFQTSANEWKLEDNTESPNGDDDDDFTTLLRITEDVQTS